MNSIPPDQLAEIRLEQKRKEVQLSQAVTILYGWSGITAIFLLGSVTFVMTGSRGFGFAAVLAIMAYGSAYIAQASASRISMGATLELANDQRMIYNIFQKISFGSGTLGAILLIIGVCLR